MYYAIIDTRSDVNAATCLLWGNDLQTIAKKVIAECKRVLDEDYEDMTLDEIEEEYEDAYFDEYRSLKRKRKITAETLCGFVFSVGDLSIEVADICEGYSSLSLSFDKYVQDKPELYVWKMAGGIIESEEQLNAMNDELLALCDMGSAAELNYFCRR